MECKFPDQWRSKELHPIFEKKGRKDNENIREAKRSKTRAKVEAMSKRKRRKINSRKRGEKKERKRNSRKRGERKKRKTSKTKREERKERKRRRD